MIKLENLKIPLDIVTNGASLILLEVHDVYDYKDGKKTETKIGLKYDVVETKHFEKFSVKIIGSRIPIVSNSEINDSEGKIIVEFQNAFAKPYRNASGYYDLSISASQITLVE